MNPLPLSVVLVEDDPDEKDIFNGFLKRRPDLDIRAFFDSAQELSGYLEQLPSDVLPDLIFLDQNMPRFTGLQLLQQLKSSALFQSIPIVIYSTYVDTALSERCLQAGALVVFNKPLTSAGYNEMMDDVLRLLGRG